MNFQLTLRVAAPAVAVGLLLLAACLAGVRSVNHLQRNLADILSENVASLQAAQELELAVRQLRYHSLLYLMDPSPARLEPVQADEVRFGAALASARQSSTTDEELACVGAIESGYGHYQEEQARLRAEAVRGKPAAEFARVADSHPVRLVVDPCQELLRINKERMEQTAAETQRASRQGSVAMVLLGLAGPVSGLVMGYGVARGLRQSIYRLSVRVQDMAQHLDQDVATVSVVADGDFHHLDRQMQQIVGQVEEVTGRLQRQQHDLLRAEQLAAVGQLAAGVAHEVRNPLTGIKILVEAARRPNSPRTLDAEDLRMIHRELGRVERTVQGLLDYARLPPPRRTPCDLRDVVGPALDVVRERAEQQGVILASHAPSQPAVAHVDRDQMHTVLVNLMLNALDAMPGGSRLEVAWDQATDGGVRLTVCDSGAGIPAAVVPRLFAPFATTKPTGTGLGLSLSARIVEEHGGTIAAANRPEGGACFTIILPEPPAEGRP